MNRRAVIVASAGVLTGCTVFETDEASSSGRAPTRTVTPTATETATATDTETATPEPRHPFAHGSTAVYVDRSETTSTLDLPAIAESALSYWRTHSSEYVGFQFEYDIIDATAPADLHLRFLNEFEGTCGRGHDDDIAGCADLLTPGMEVETAEAEVVAGSFRREVVREVTIHELGHILGLEHTDEPLRYMSNDPEVALQAGELRVEMSDEYSAAWEAAGTGTVEWNAGIDQWNAEQYRAASDKFDACRDTFDRARRKLDECVRLHERVRVAGAGGYESETVASMLTAAATEADAMVTAAEHMSAAASALESNHHRSAESHRRDANQALETANDQSVAPPFDFSVALGMGMFVTAATTDTETASD